MNSQQPHESSSGTVTLRELIKRIQFYYTLCIKRWVFLTLMCTPFVVFFGYKHFTFKPSYEAEVKFLVEGSTSSFGGLGGLLGQFGIRNTGKANPFKVVEVAQSNYLFERILFDQSVKPNIANRLIEVYQMDELWAKQDKKFENFRFVNTQLKQLDSLEKVAFSRLLQKLTGGKNHVNPILTFVYNEDTGIFNYRINCYDENLTLDLQSAAYNNLRKFFEEDILFNSINTTIVLRDKADSIQQLITKKTYELARMQDQTLELVLATPGVKKMTLEKEIQALTLAYAEVLKSYEISDITLKDTKPMFLKLDESISPLEATTSSIIINLIKALLCGLLIGVGWLVGKEIFKEIMA